MSELSGETMKESSLLSFLKYTGRNYLTETTGMSNSEVVEYYSDRAHNYDEEVCQAHYNGPIIVANAVTNYYLTQSERESVKILDVAAGTGRVGHELQKHGFKFIDALEPSSGMLEILKCRNIYGKLFNTTIDSTQIPTILPNSYGCIVISGGMGQGCIPANAFHEMIRIVKPGGMIFNVMREDYLSLKDYDNKLEPYMKELEDKELWRQIAREVVEDYCFSRNGVVFKHEVFSR